MSVEVIGVVTMIDLRNKSLHLAIDDGTDTLACVYWLPDEMIPTIPWPISLGSVIVVRGRIIIFQEERRLNIHEVIANINITNEILWRLQTAYLHGYVYVDDKAAYLL